MYKALLYKEWIKLRWFLVFIFVLNCAILLRVALKMRSVFEFVPANEAWYKIIIQNSVYYSEFKYSSLLIAVILGFAQFVPETLKKRLRLLFHLPCSYYRSIYFMIGIGLSFLIFALLLNLLGGALISFIYFSKEVVESYLLTFMPWFLGAIFCYLGLVAIIIDPKWWFKILGIIFLYGFIDMFYIQSLPAAFEDSLWKYFVIGALYIFSSITPIIRFKNGGANA